MWQWIRIFDTGLKWKEHFYVPGTVLSPYINFPYVILLHLSMPNFEGGIIISTFYMKKKLSNYICGKEIMEYNL